MKKKTVLFKFLTLIVLTFVSVNLNAGPAAVYMLKPPIIQYSSFYLAPPSGIDAEIEQVKNDIFRLIGDKDALSALKDNIGNDVFNGDTEGETLARLNIIKTLLEIDQGHLFAGWDKAGVNDDKKIAFADRMVRADEKYPGGLKKYYENALTLLESSKRGDTPFEGFVPSVPSTINMDLPAIVSMDASVAKEAAKKLAIVLVAGGVGDRLGYDGAKVEIPMSLVDMKPYIQNYAENIKAIQDISGTDAKIPFVIMTSDDTDYDIKEWLKDNNYCGLDEDQVIILKQEMVPAITNNNGDFARAKGDHYSIQFKPHGHGDIHMLMYQSGLYEKWAKEGRDYTAFIQDTNGQVFNGLLAGFGISLKNKVTLNFLTVPRKAGEAAGAIMELKNEEKGIVRTQNVEYNMADPMLRSVEIEKIKEEVKAGNQEAIADYISLGKLVKMTSEEMASLDELKYVRIDGTNYVIDKSKLDGDKADPNTGYSPYPANLNVFILNNSKAYEVLKPVDGLMPEFINPKYADEAKEKFKKPTRLETMMQDIAEMMKGEKVVVTNFNKRFVFSPVKNEIAVAKDKRDGMPYGEADFYKENRRLLKEIAGVDINVDGKDVTTKQGLTYEKGAEIVFNRRFSPTLEGIKEHFKGENKISDNSTVVLDGDIYFENVDINGAIRIKLADGVRLTVKGLKLENGGVTYKYLTDEELKNAPGYVKLRGYEIDEANSDIMDVEITEPGNYVMDETGEIRKIEANSLIEVVGDIPEVGFLNKTVVEEDLQKLLSDKAKDELKDIEIVLNSELKSLGRVVKKNEIELSPIATQSKVILLGTVIHELVENRLLDVNNISPAVKDVIAGIIELRVILKYTLDLDKEYGNMPGTAINQLVVGYLRRSKNIRTKPILRLLGSFKNVEGDMLTKQIDAISRLAEAKHGLEKGALNDEKNKIMLMTTTIMDDLFGGNFEDEIRSMNETKLNMINEILKEKHIKQDVKRRVIIDLKNGTVDDLNAQSELIENLIAMSDMRELFVWKDNVLSKVNIKDKKIELIEYGKDIKTLDNATVILKTGGAEVRVVSSDNGDLMEVKDNDILLFSVAEAKRVAKEKGYELPCEVLILPYVLNLNKDDIKKHEGVNNMFKNKVKFYALNIDYIDNFGKNLEEAFGKVLDAVKSAISEAQARRAIEIAA